MAETSYWPQALGDGGFTGGPTATVWEPHNFMYGAAISVLSAGTATKIAVRCEAVSGTPTLKLGLFDVSKNLVAQSTVLNGSGAAWREATISGAVSVATYYVMMSSSDTNSLYYYNTGFNGVASTVAYAAAMPASMTTTDETNLLYAVRVTVDSGGGGDVLLRPRVKMGFRDSRGLQGPGWKNFS